MFCRKIIFFTALFFLSFDLAAQTSADSVSVAKTSLSTESWWQGWRASFFSLASVSAVQLDRGDASVGSYNYLSATRKIDNNFKFSLRLPFTYSTEGLDKFGKNQDSIVQLQDIFVALSQSEWISGDAWKLSGSQRLYFPTSEYSQLQNMLTRLRIETFLETPTAKYSRLSYVTKFDYYIQRQTAFVDTQVPRNSEGVYVRDPRRANKMASLEHYVEYTGNINRWLDMKPLLGFVEDWYYASAIEGFEARHTTDFKSALGFGLDVHRNFNFLLSYENRTNLGSSSRGEPVAFYQPEDNTLVLLTNVFF